MIVVKFPNGQYYCGYKETPDLQNAVTFRNITGAKCALNQRDIDYEQPGIEFLKVMIILYNQTCETCKYWSGIPVAKSKFHACLNEKIDCEGLDDIEHVASIDGYDGGLLITRKDFACNQWEKMQ